MANMTQSKLLQQELVTALVRNTVFCSGPRLLAMSMMGWTYKISPGSKESTSTANQVVRYLAHTAFGSVKSLPANLCSVKKLSTISTTNQAPHNSRKREVIL